MYLQKLELLVMSCAEKTSNIIELQKSSSSCGGDYNVKLNRHLRSRRWLIGKGYWHLCTMVYCTDGRKHNRLTLCVLQTYTYILLLLGYVIGLHLSFDTS
jgi:hypothetical protein